jgi:6-phosphofructokinase 1
MNAAIRAVTRAALYRGAEVVGIRRGYEGALRGDFVPLTTASVGGIIEEGGTILFSARCEEFKTEAAQRRALSVLRGAGIEGIVTIGGNGTQTGALALHERGYPVVGVASTIDNDLSGTDYTIGCDTAANTIVDAIDRLRDTASSHERTFLVETMGRKCGWLALQAGLATGADIVLIPEIGTTLEEVAARVRRRQSNGKGHTIIVVAEGYGSAIDIGRALRDALGVELRVSVLGHIQRGGAPTAFDRVLASRLGAAAANALLNRDSGVVMGLRGNTVVPVPAADAISQLGRIDLDTYLLEGVFAI